MSSNEAPPNTNTDPAASDITFADLGLRPGVLQSLAEMGFTKPMKVQAETIPLVQQGKDILVQSRTGSGKTAAFGIPIIDRLIDVNVPKVQAIALMPTRELALQVAAEMARIASQAGVAVVPIYGGAPMGRQIEQLRAGGHIVCGTPGRILDHLRRGTLSLDAVKCAVLDECDEMLSMGFQEDIEAILEHTPASRQTMLFSATVPEGIQRLARRFMRNPVDLKLSADFVGVNEIRHVYYAIPGGDREKELLRVIEFENPERGIIFCNTREETGRVAEFLRKQGMDSEAISSDLSQADRERVMGRMRARELRFLVATDVAARGIDLESLSHVFNFSFPDSPEIYIHRTGRTGRAGKSGTAISLVGPSEVGAFYYVKLLYKIKPEERSLPSATEIRSRREGEQLLALRERFPGEAAGGWGALARRLLTAVDAERLVGALLESALGGGAATATVRPTPKPVPVLAPPGRPERPRATPETRESRPAQDRPARPDGFARSDRPARSPGFDRGPRPDRPERSPRDRDPRDRDPRDRDPRDRDPRDRAPVARDSRPEAPSPRLAPEAPALVASTPAVVVASAPPEAAVWSDSPRPSARPSTPPRPTPPPETKGGEFWEVWNEAGTSAPATEPPAAEAPARRERPAPRAHGGTEAGPGSRDSTTPAPGQIRVFLSLGRKDNATADEILGLLSSCGVTLTAHDVELMNTHTYLNLPSGDAERLCSELAGRDHNGRRLLCEPAKPRSRR